MSKRNKTTQKAQPAPQPTLVVEPTETAPRKASIVPTVYKERYGKAGNNGDWFAKWANANLLNPDHTVNTEAVSRLAAENGYDDSKLARTGNGWQGKHRMTVGNVIRNRIKKNGSFQFNGKAVRQ